MVIFIITVIQRTRVVYELIAHKVRSTELAITHIRRDSRATKKTSRSQCIIYILLKYSQFSNVNNLGLYRIKHYLSLFKKNSLTNFAKSFKFLKNMFLAKQALFDLKTIIFFTFRRETYSILIRKKLYVILV